MSDHPEEDQEVESKKYLTFFNLISNHIPGPRMLNRTGKCDYATQLRHPAGCATIISAHGKGMGWFGTFLTIIFCLFGAYLVVGAVYRFFFLHIRGIDNYSIPASKTRNSNSGKSGQLPVVREEQEEVNELPRVYNCYRVCVVYIKRVPS